MFWVEIWKNYQILLSENWSYIKSCQFATLLFEVTYDEYNKHSEDAKYILQKLLGEICFTERSHDIYISCLSNRGWPKRYCSCKEEFFD